MSETKANADGDTVEYFWEKEKINGLRRKLLANIREGKTSVEELNTPRSLACRASEAQDVCGRCGALANSNHICDTTPIFQPKRYL